MNRTLVKIGMGLAIAAAMLVGSGWKAEAGVTSYAYATLSDNSTRLIKYNGVDFVADIELISGGPLASGLNSSGSRVSLLTLGGAAYAARPGEYDLILADSTISLISGAAWVAPAGRHGGLGGAIYRVQDNGSSVQLITGQTMTRGQLMGDFRTDLFGGTASTLGQRHTNGSPVTVFSAVQMTRSVMAGDGSIAQFTGGLGVRYVRTNFTSVVLSPTSMDNNIGGKAGAYGFFNADDQSYKYDSIGNSLTTAFASPLGGFTRVGELGLLSAGGTTYLYNSRDDSFTTFGLALSPFTQGLEFGDYAFLNLDFGGGLQTYVARDTGQSGLSALSYTLFSVSPLDLTRATGGIIPEPSAMALAAVGILIGWRRKQDRA